MLRVFIGFDQKEAMAFHVLSNSIRRHASSPIAIIPLDLQNLSKIYTREHDSRQSNEFSFTRFLVPYLSGYEGISVFMDCDMLVTFDMNELMALDIEGFDVALVKHEYKPKRSVKYLGTIQEAYPRKNWSSFIVYNNASDGAKKLTPEYVNQAPAADLHRFTHIPDDRIHSLGVEYNFLVEEYERLESIPKVIHWTVGGPYFNDFEDADYSELWFYERELALNVAQWK